MRVTRSMDGTEEAASLGGNPKELLAQIARPRMQVGKLKAKAPRASTCGMAPLRSCRMPARRTGEIPALHHGQVGLRDRYRSAWKPLREPTQVRARAHLAGVEVAPLWGGY